MADSRHLRRRIRDVVEFLVTRYLLATRSRSIDAYLRTHAVRKLQLGAGPNSLPSWMNTDLRPWSLNTVIVDVTEPFPFEDATFDYIFSEHQIEHISYRHGLYMLEESFRVLKPGGTIRIATPDLARILSLYAPERGEMQERYITWTLDRFEHGFQGNGAAFVINNFVRSWGHQFIYDHPTLQATLEHTGFVEVTCHRPGESADATLQGIESHGRLIGEEFNQFESLVLEARRPRS